MQPKQIFDAYTKSDIKGFKTDEKGMRVALRKLAESEKAEPAAAYQTFGNSVVNQNQNVNEINYIDNKNKNNKNESLYSNVNTSNVNNFNSEFENSNFNPSEFLVSSGRKDNAALGDNEVERVKAEMNNLNMQLKSLQSANAELNAKIKNASEQPKTSI